MKTFLAMTALAALTVSMATGANAWERHRSITGPNGGTATLNATGSCANGTCTRSVTRSGPNGYNTSRQRTLTCANGTCTGSVQGYGPYRGNYGHTGSITRY